jgi:tRNA (guanine-N7-)-methyltransferase
MVQDLTPRNKNSFPMKSQLYGRRKGRSLRGTKQRLWNDWRHTVTFSLPEANTSLNVQELFKSNPLQNAAPLTSQEFWLEIGFGSGEHLIHQALHNPKIGLLGCEAFVNGIANALLQMHTQKISNIRIFPNDVRLLLPSLPPASLARVFILFPDPWPKARHQKRRLITASFVDALARVLKAGGDLRLATDDAAYAEEMRKILADDKRFIGLQNAPEQWQIPPADWHPTRYEQRGKKLDRMCNYFSYKRHNDF